MCSETYFEPARYILDFFDIFPMENYKKAVNSNIWAVRPYYSINHVPEGDVNAISALLDSYGFQDKSCLQIVRIV